MLHRIVTAGFQNVVEADYIAFDVSIWVSDGVSHTRLCAEVDHDVRVVLLEDAVDESFVRKVTFNKGVVLKLPEFSQTRFLDSNVVVVVHVVQTDDLCVRLGGQDTLGKIQSDETG